MELTKATLELLRDEAYVFISRDALRQHESTLNRENVPLSNSRFPVDMLARKRATGTFASSICPASDIETAAHDRLDLLARFESLLQERIRRDLVAHFEAASLEYQRFGRIQQLLNEWEFGVRRLLPDTLTSFERELRELRLAVTAVGATPNSYAKELSSLRGIAVRLEAQDHQLSQVAAAIAGYAHGVSQGNMRVPALPHFRRTVWVDWLSVIPIEEVVSEVRHVEREVRVFLDSAVHPALARAQASRVCCSQLQENFVQNYWNQLRVRAKAHHVEKRSVDAVLATLGQRYDAEITRRHRNPTHDPFLAER